MFLSKRKICNLIDKVFLDARVYYALYNVIIIYDVVNLRDKRKVRYQIQKKNEHILLIIILLIILLPNCYLLLFK